MTSAATTVGRKSVASESRRNCINLSSLSRATASHSASIARLNLPSRRDRLRFALHYFHIISHPRNRPRWRPGPYGWQSSRRGARRDTQGRPMGWLLLSCHFRLSGRRHRYLPLFISRLLNYIPINNALPILPGELIYHSTGEHRTGGRILLFLLLQEAVKSSHLSSGFDWSSGGIASSFRILRLICCTALS